MAADPNADMLTQDALETVEAAEPLSSWDAEDEWGGEDNEKELDDKIAEHFEKIYQENYGSYDSPDDPLGGLRRMLEEGMEDYEAGRYQDFSDFMREFWKEIRT